MHCEGSDVWDRMMLLSIWLFSAEFGSGGKLLVSPWNNFYLVVSRGKDMTTDPLIGIILVIFFIGPKHRTCISISTPQMEPFLNNLELIMNTFI